MEHSAFKKILRYECVGGHTCGLCGKTINTMPYVIIQPIRDYGDFESSVEYSIDAHRRCARRIGLKNIGDTAPDREEDF